LEDEEDILIWKTRQNIEYQYKMPYIFYVDDDYIKNILEQTKEI